jgi:ribosomal protein S18 acetylase RimI-like enzyme
MPNTNLPLDPVIELRPLHAEAVPRLAQIRPTYRSATILDLDKQGEGYQVTWQLVERTLPVPFDKGALYDFTADVQAEIAERLSRPDETYHRVAVCEEQFVGLLDAEIHRWNSTLFIWNLMIDLDFRGKGIGRRLWRRAVEFARSARLRAIMCETQNTNVAACKFYTRMGCELAGLNEALYTNEWRASEFALFWLYRLR